MNLRAPITALVLLIALTVVAQQPPPAPMPSAPAPQSIVVLHYMVRMHRNQGTTTFEAWAGPDAAKTVVRDTDDRGFKPGLIMIARNDGEVRQMANLQRGEYVEFTRAQMEATAKQKMAGFSFAPFEVKETLNEAGDKVLGLATTHRRIEMTSTFVNGGARHTFHAIQDVWVTRGVTLPNPKLEMLFSQGFTGNPAVDNVSFTELGGFPVRRETTLEIDGQDFGRSTYDLLAVETTRVGPKELELPPGLKQMQLPSNQ